MSKSNSEQLAPAAAEVAGPGTPGWYPRVGEVWPGQGIYAGIVRGDPGQPDHHVFMSANPASYHAGIAWGGAGTDEPGATSERDGLANTRALIASSTPHPAASWAVGLDLEGHKDWYLPSRRELRLLWINAPELFASGWYWSSTQSSARTAWTQYFDDGGQNFGDKSYEARARAVRRLVIE